MAGVNSRFASISESEIIKIQKDSVPENTKKATKFGLKVFKGTWRSHILQTIVFQFVYWDNYTEQRVSRMNWDVKLDVNKIIFHWFPSGDVKIVGFWDHFVCIY